MRKKASKFQAWVPLFENASDPVNFRQTPIELQTVAGSNSSMFRLYLKWFYKRFAVPSTILSPSSQLITLLIVIVNSFDDFLVSFMITDSNYPVVHFSTRTSAVPDTVSVEPLIKHPYICT